LPFFPYSSDDGFSVINYRQVDNRIGTWDDIHRLSENYLLMFDAVINHISRESDWFQAYLKGESPYSNYFIEIDPSTNLSSIFRPRALPLLHPVDTVEGQKYVWTTFSEDQIDLNFSNPQVLLEIIKLILFYSENGASLIRLDAVGYIWKLVGSSSLNLPQAHAVVKILRAVLNIAAPNTGIITETNVPHEENIAYFGEIDSEMETPGKPRSGDEAQMVYNFSLAPLILHTFHTENASILSNWARTLGVPFQDSAFFNFIASHDGIGVMPAKDLLSDEQIQALVDKTLLHGGEASFKTNSDGTKSVYELNITLFDALNDPAEENSNLAVKRFLASQAIMLSLAGVPGIYIHSLFGSQNCFSCQHETGRARSLNREKFDLDQLKSDLENQENIHRHILNEYRSLLLIRQTQPAFHPAAAQEIIDSNNAIFILLRTNKKNQSRILCLINVSSNFQPADIDLSGLGLNGIVAFDDLLSDQSLAADNGHLQVSLEAYQIQWLIQKFPVI
jgi:sucrose phosphorylase